MGKFHLCQPLRFLATQPWAGTGGDQVADACQTREGQWIGPGSTAQTRDFRQPASDKSSFGVFAEAHAAVQARADGNDIFQCTTQIYADHVVRTGDSELPGRQDFACL